jgi:hypothetical protein
MVLFEISGQNCLGKLLRDTGHSRVPEPPERMTGTICFGLACGMWLSPIKNELPTKRFEVSRADGFVQSRMTLGRAKRGRSRFDRDREPAARKAAILDGIDAMGGPGAQLFFA